MRSIFLALAALAFVASATEDAAAAEAACTPHPVTVLPLISFERPVIEAAIDGTPVIMLIDTGAEVTSVTPAAAARLKLKPDPTRHTTAIKLGGTTTVGNVIAPKLALGSQIFSQLDLPVLPMQGAERTPDGAIGADLLHVFDLDIDLPRRRLTLYHPGGCKTAAPPWPAPAERLPVTITSRGQILIAAKIDGHAVAAIFDTGSLREGIARDAVLRLGVTGTELARDYANKTIGPLNYSFRRHRFDRLVLGPETFTDAWFDVIDFHEPGIDALIGIDYMLKRRFFVSYAAGTMFMQRELPPPP